MKPNGQSTHDKIAIVGMGFRWPGGVATCAELQSFLEQNGDGIVDVPADRWDRGRFFSANKKAPGRTYVHRGGFLEQDVFSLDPAPFALSPRESLQLDPQQRLLLEVAWDALDDAGLPLDELRGSSTGVYVGGFMLDSRDIWGLPENRSLIEGQSATGSGNTVLSNRLSYTFDFHGPSMTVDTACSSSLVTLHLACRDLVSGACDVALAGGVNVMLSPLSTLLMCKGQFLAPDGRSKAFDAAADGYGRGEGSGLVVLKRLSDAERDGDRIYAVILATGVNQDGRTDGMPLPNGEAQVALSRSVSQKAGIDPARVGYVEAHGTGTKAGDTTEVAALAQVYAGPGRKTKLSIGSIKTNIGHTEAAAGIAGVIKAALSLYCGKIFPLRALAHPNPAIDFEGLGIQIPLVPLAWPEDVDRTAAVNSFGYGGTNAHAVLAAPEFCGVGNPSSTSPTAGERRARLLLPLSACDDVALRERAGQVAPLAERSLFELQGTLAHHRSQLSHRMVAVAEDGKECSQTLRDFAEGRDSPLIVRDRADVTKLCCVYTGMGPQWWGMGRELLESEPVFRAAAEEVDAHFRSVAGWSLLDEMNASEAASKMDSNRVAQPANFLLQVALTRLLWSYGVQFEGYLGHSVGELTAAWASGCLSLPDATFAAFHRSDLQQQVAGRGTMLAASISLEEAEALCRRSRDVSIAAINGSKSVALAGDREELEAIAATLGEQEVFARMMRVEVAYHSAHMEPLREQFLSRLAPLAPRSPQARLFSTVLGEEVRECLHDATYFWQNARQPVLLRAALSRALEAGFDGFLEVGPHPVLAGAIFAGAREMSRPAKSLATLNRKESQSLAFDKALASLYCAGVALDWKTLAPSAARLELPAYPFQRKRYWQESAAATEFRLGRPGAHPFLDQRIAGTGLQFRTELDDTRFPWLAGHEIQGSRVFPGAGYLEVGFAMCQELGLGNCALEDVQFSQALVLPDDAFAQLDVCLHGEELVIGSDTGSGYAVNARMRLPRKAQYGQGAALDFDAARKGLEEVDVADAYGRMAGAGLGYSGAFRALQRVWQGGGTTLAEIELGDVAGYLLFPATLDAAFQSLLLAERLERALVPVQARTVRWNAPAKGKKLFALSKRTAVDRAVFDVRLFDEAGSPVASVDGLVCAPVDKGGELRSSELEWIHEDTWAEVEPPQGLRGGAPLELVLIDEAFGAEVTDALGAAGLRTREIQEQRSGPRHVLFGSGADADLLANDAQQRLLAIVAELPSGSRLTILTRGAQSVNTEAATPSEAAICGLGRVIMTERPKLVVRIVDLPRGPIHPELLKAAVLAEDEEETALRGELRFARRIVRRPAKNERRLAERRPMEPGESVELFAIKTGAIDSLAYRPRIFAETLADDEIEIDVEYSSLNFKDLMKVMGLLGETALERTYLGNNLGIEGAGRAVRVGAAVEHVKAGDLVVGFFGGALSTRVRAAAHLTVVVGDKLGARHAASLLVFLTAWHGLVERAQLKRGERVLIHAAAGGVGLAAIQIAQSVGAEIFATAGNDTKREYLRSLGIKHVYDSRTLDYASAIRRDSAERGVDVVLNSLAGEHLRQSLQLLAPGGRFIELGKQDFAENGSLGLLPFNRAISFHAVDLDRMSLEAPAFFRPLAEEVCRRFEEEQLTPLPTEFFPAADVSLAFRRLSDADRVGKIVVDFTQGVGDVAPGFVERRLFERSRSYLVVGGLAGFGLRTAEWIAEQGAGAVVLASRRGLPSPEERLRLDRLAETTGCAVAFEALDVTDLAAVRALIEKLARLEKPLAGVFHAGAVLDDRPLEAIDPASWDRVLGPKALGAWNLDLASRAVALEHFVLFSSVSALIGNPGQGAYAAANAFLDGLAKKRHAEGLRATSVSWGAIADVGMLARDAATGGHLRSIGFASMKADRALEALRLVLNENRVDAGIVSADWVRWQRHTPEVPWRRLSLLDVGAGEGEGNELARRLQELPEEDQFRLVEEIVAQAVAPAFKLGVADLDLEKPLRDLGLDSLLAVEVQARIEELTGVELSSMEILSGRPTSALAALVKSRLEVAAALAREPERAPQYSLTPGNLRDFFLERICVQPPYFALENVRETETGLAAEVLTVGRPAQLLAGWALAEAGRHLAILGSCAARQLLPADEGRIYYPVRESKLLKSSSAELPDRAELRARCTFFDAKRSTATAEAELLGDNGEILFAFEVTYHVIRQAEFQQIFARHSRPTNEASGANPYLSLERPKAERIEPGFFLGATQRVEEARCLGHFVDYPAYPVSIMLRDALGATHQAICAEHGADATFQLTGGTCRTTKFIFAGEEVQLAVRRISHAGHDAAFRCEFVSAGEVAAAFDLEVCVSSESKGSARQRSA